MIWIKDNDQEIETNDLPATVAHCKSIGWKEKKAVTKVKEPKVDKPKLKDIN